MTEMRLARLEVLVLMLVDMVVDSYDTQRSDELRQMVAQLRQDVEARLE